MDFHELQRAVAAKFQHMQKQQQLFRVKLEHRDELVDLYLASFPEGTNQIYRKRTEHDCACCKNFIRTIGDVVAIEDGQLVSIWDVEVPSEPAYEVVTEAMARLVKSRPVENVFYHYASRAGIQKTFEEIIGASPKRWEHFFVDIDQKHYLQEEDIPTHTSVLRTDQAVLFRGLNDLNIEDVDTVLDLIAQNSLYRGAEFKPVLEGFRALLVQAKTTDVDLLAWTAPAHASVKRIRNSAIGTLLCDLAEGKGLEEAVKAYEKVVAPASYKRTTALVTPQMVAKAREEVEGLGLTSALERRYATLDDLSINNLLFADRSVRKAMGEDDPFAVATSKKQTQNFDRLEEVPIEKFLSDILPRAESVEVLVENKHAGNFVSLIAPTNPTAGQLFKWPNRFSWAYSGDVADAIKERVKEAGGNVDADLCCRLAWHSPSDLDLHLFTPEGHVYYHNKRVGGAVLDLDMNGIDRHDPENPVENIFFQEHAQMRPGEYQLKVNAYNMRSTRNPGFKVQIEWFGEIRTFEYDKPMHHGQWVDVATFRYRRGEIEWFTTLSSSTASREVWGLKTQQFHRVRAALLSPNYWDDNAIGNKHYFFMLDGCANDGTARGFFNEFLRNDLNEHRKVLEMVGAKMQAGGPDQLSGLGFSSTAKNTLVCRVKGSFTRQLKIVF